MAYGTDEAMQNYWAELGYQGPTDSLSTLRRIASRYIDGKGYDYRRGRWVCLFPGIPTDMFQENEWPRTNARDRHGREIAPDMIPMNIEIATYEAAYYASQNPGALNTAMRSDQVVKREKFDSVEFEYAEGQEGSSAKVMIPFVDTLLAPYLGAAGIYGGFAV